MNTKTISTSDCVPQTIVIGRRGTYYTQEITFDLTFLIDTYGSGVAALMVKRSADTTAYPAVVSQDGNVLTWEVSETDTYYTGAGVAQLMWFVDGGLAKTIIYPVVVLKDILQTTEEPPDAYQNWVESLTALGAETLQNAQNAAQSAEDAEAAAAMLQNVSATATTLEPGSEATASYEDGVFSFGIPRGEPGGGGGGTGNYNDLSNKPQINGVTLSGNKTAADLNLGTYTKPENGIPKADLTAGVQASLDKADTALQSAPVTSVAGKTGAVTLGAGDVGFSGSETYADGTIGKAVSDVNQALSLKITAPSSPTTGQFLVYDGSAWTAQTVPSASGVSF
jgi:hypothetical protein